MNAYLLAAFAVNASSGVVGHATRWDELGLILVQLLVIVCLVALNGFFVASEFAIVKVRASQLDALAAQGNRRARHARQVVAHLDAYLSATQLGGSHALPTLCRASRPYPRLGAHQRPAGAV